MGSLTGKTAVVTGAASGIGRAIALALAREGASVCIADMDAGGGKRVADEIVRAGGQGRAIQVDVSKTASVQRMVGDAAQAFGRLDILVNNAGLQFVAPIADYPEDKWELLVGVMLTGTFLCTKYALPHMIKGRWGRVVNIASAHGLIASPFKSAYVAAKHGIVGFTKVAALELGEHGITVNAICPGYVRTPLVEGQIDDLARTHGMPASEVVEKIMLAPVAIKRLIEPDEIAAFVAYLCTDAAAMVTGVTHTIDGGWTAR
ncbi:MAG: 3-hydroxybutyrate dehydrogenase [Armatimonadota bacterium]